MGMIFDFPHSGCKQVSLLLWPSHAKFPKYGLWAFLHINKCVGQKPWIITWVAHNLITPLFYSKFCHVAAYLDQRFLLLSPPKFWGGNLPFACLCPRNPIFLYYLLYFHSCLSSLAKGFFIDRWNFHSVQEIIISTAKNVQEIRKCGLYYRHLVKKSYEDTLLRDHS